MKTTMKRISAAATKAAVALAFALFAATTAVADEDLNGGTRSITTADGLKGKTWINGTLDVSANQTLADATTTLGSGLTVNQTSGWWGLAGTTTLNINGATVNYTSTSTPYFGKRASNEGTYGGTTSVSLNNGKFICSSTDIKFTARASSTTDNRDVVISFTMASNSEMAVPSGKNITFGGMEQVNSKKHKTLKMTASVADSKITANQITIGQTTSYLNTPASSANTITFGSGADLTLYHQIYAYLYPQPSVKFNGATIHYAGASGNKSFIGQNTAVTTDIYEIQSGGLTIDIPSGVSLTTDDNSSALKGAGGITKTGAGSITWNNITGSSPTKKMTFTGPLVVSNGTWASTKDYAASAFRAEGGNLTLSGALSASSVVLSATDGGVLTLAGATITDDSPDLTLASGGTTDYFTRDGAVAAYTLDAFTLGAGGILSLDANATETDAISVTTTNITATAANPATINLNFTAAPAAGTTFALFETDDAAKFNVNPTFGAVALPHEVAVVNGALTLTITADDYTWNGSGTSWDDTGAWDRNSAAADWEDGNNAIFATANATAALAADAFASEVRFTADTTVTGSATLTVPSVSVVADVSATISAPTAGAIEKTGAGTLALGASRTAQTTVTEGTLKVLSGATVAPAKLTLGTDAEKPVTFDYGGQTLSTDLSAAANRYMAPGMYVTLTNGVFHTTVNPAFDATTAPNVLTIAKDAVFRSSARYTWNASYDANVDSDTMVNIYGGQMISQNSGNNNWFMQNSRRGKLRFNVTDGGLFQTGGDTYIMTCRDNTTEADTPEMYMMFSNSTFRVANNKTLSIGYDGDNKNPLEPKFSLAMTNSVLDVGTGIIYLGHNVVGENTAGFYTADFVDSVISAKCFKVYHDRPANSARFDNSTLVLTGTDSWSIETHQDFGPSSTPMTIGAGGLTIDTQAFNCNLQADPQGEGAIVKKGSGILNIQRNQTATGALNVNEGTLALGASVATLSRPLSFADGTTLDVAGGAPVAITSIALPASGDVTLVKGGAAFAKGVYRIFSGNVAAADVQGRLVPLTGGEVYSWMVKDGVLLLNVGNLPGNAWTGFAGDGKMSTDANWLDETAPVAGEAVDFSGVTAAATIEGDIDAALGAVTMGSGIVTFTGDKMKAASFSDMSKVAVGANSTVTLDGNLVFSGTTTKQYIVNTVASGGRFVVTGYVEASSNLTDGEIFHSVTPGAGAVQANGLKANQSTSDEWIFRLGPPADGTANWIVGAEGLSGSKYFYVNAIASRKAAIQPLDSDFSITTGFGNRSTLTLNTTGFDGNAHTITIAEPGYILLDGPIVVSGSGTLVADGGSTTSSGTVTVKDKATLAINAGKRITTGAISLETGTTLALPQTGTVTMDGNLTLAAGTTIAYTLSAAGQTTLDVTGKTLTLPAAEADPVVVSLGVKPNAAVRSKTPYTLISGANLTEDDLAKFTLGANLPEWVRGENALVVEDGDLKLYTMNPGLCIKIK